MSLKRTYTSLALLGAAAVFLPGCQDLSHNEVSQENFQQTVVENETPTLVEFWRGSCGWCVKLKPELEALETEMGDKINIVSMHASEGSELMEQYNLRGVPAMLLYKDGEVIGQTTGYRSHDKLKSWVNTRLQGAAAPQKPKATQSPP